MRFIITLIVSISVLAVSGQERSKKLIKSVESNSPEDYARIVSDLKRTPEELKTEKVSVGTTNTIPSSNPSSTSTSVESRPENTSAIAHGEARLPTPTAAKVYKYKADERSVDYYNELRKKFEEEDKIKKEKDAQLALEKAKQEEELKKSRHLTDDQAPQFERFRQGEKNPEVKKTTAEEDYKALFK